MKKFFLFALAAFLLTSCDNFKGSSNKEDETEEEEKPKKKKKKAGDEEEDTNNDEDENNNEDENTDNEEDTDNEDDTDNDEDTDSRGWSSSDRSQFMNTCVSESQRNLSESQARSYCSCMMGKLEKKYPNSDDAKNLTQSDLLQMAQDCLGK